MTTNKFIHVFLFILFITPTFLLAQKPQKIRGIAREVKSIEYYQEQSGLWKKLLEKDYSNSEAWRNHYWAERAKLQLQKPDLWANEKDQFFTQLQPILETAKKHIDGTFDYYFILGSNAKGETSINAFKKAFEINPDRSEIYSKLMAYYIPLLDKDKLTDLSKNMLKSNLYSNANLMWNYNALQSLAPSGVILTHGDMDSFPKWVLHYGANIRPDVLIINTWFLGTDEPYRKKNFEKMGMAPLSKKESDFENLRDYIDYITAETLKNSKRPIYTSSGTPKEFLKKYELADKMYLVGNVLKYSEEKFNNTAAIKKNIEEVYVLDYLFNNFQVHEDDEVIKTQMNLTYLPSLIHLRKYYEAKNEKASIERCVRLIDKIADDSGRRKEVLSWFEN